MQTALFLPARLPFIFALLYTYPSVGQQPRRLPLPFMPSPPPPVPPRVLPAARALALSGSPHLFPCSLRLADPPLHSARWRFSRDLGDADVTDAAAAATAALEGETLAAGGGSQ